MRRDLVVRNLIAAGLDSQSAEKTASGMRGAAAAMLNDVLRLAGLPELHGPR